MIGNGQVETRNGRSSDYTEEPNVSLKDSGQDNAILNLRIRTNLHRLAKGSG